MRTGWVGFPRTLGRLMDRADVRLFERLVREKKAELADLERQLAEARAKVACHSETPAPEGDFGEGDDA